MKMVVIEECKKHKNAGKKKSGNNQAGIFDQVIFLHQDLTLSDKTINFIFIIYFVLKLYQSLFNRKERKVVAKNAKSSNF